MASEVFKGVPTTIRVGWADYRVEQWPTADAVGARMYGQACHASKVIRIDERLDAHQAAETMIHEVLHTVYTLWAIDDKDDEERTVSALSHGVTQVWRDNPKLVAWIEKSLRD